MHVQRMRMSRSVGAVVAAMVVGALVVGCPSRPPPNDNTNINDNGDPPPGTPVRIDATWIGDGIVDQESEGNDVTLTAIPGEGSEFIEWTEADLPDPTANPITVDADEVPVLRATFAEIVVPPLDTDGDGVADEDDNCPTSANADQADGDDDGFGDVCDNCPDQANANQTDGDDDGVGDDCDNCPAAANTDQADTDEDGHADACDNCPGDANADQADADSDGIGDACEGDQDADGIPDEDDNCPASANADQADTDDDTVGDACDTCPSNANTDQLDGDDDGLGDVCDACPNDSENDADRDGVCGDIDQCPDTPLHADVNAVGCETNGGPTPVCGNGAVEFGEQCEPPDTPTCDVSCQTIPNVCGNGIVEAGEQCEPPDTATCDANCQTIPDNTAVCGNSEIEAGEECDDGNRVAGDGCDESCMLEPGGPENDECANSMAVTDGVTEFSNVLATTDGEDEPDLCSFFEYTQIDSDVWFVYEATCDGELVITLCGSSYDTKMAVYPGLDCATGLPHACSDDDCGISGFESRVAFQAATGESYLIRIGGFDGEQGDGTLTILCGEVVCGTGNGDCFAEGGNASRGCDDEDCCRTTCETDPFCCDVEWDNFCAGEASGLCTGSFTTCARGAGDCGTDQGPDQGGCDQIDCCNDVCMADPFCCVDTWDDLCADRAAAMCGLTCGPGSGGCFVATGNGTPGCDSVDCCLIVCTQDPFCCQTEWDDTCAAMAADGETGCR